MEEAIDLSGGSADRLTVTTWDVADNSEDVALVRAAQDGDSGAFAELYRRYAKMVHGILLARVPATEVDDLVQDVFLRAFPKLKGLRDLRRFGGWLAAIARNRATDYHRSAYAQTEPAKMLAEEDVEILQANQGSALNGETVLELIRALPETYRETLILRLVEGMSGPEIAERTGLKPGSVRVNLHRGMQQLREKLSGGHDMHMPSTGMQGSLTARWKYVMRKRNAP